MLERLKWHYRAWRYRLKLEKQEIRWLRRLIQPGDCVVDIGAHKGAYTYWMRRAAGSEGQVFAFEPQPRLAALLRRLHRGAGCRNVVIEAMGLSSKPGTLTLKVPGRDTSPSASFEDTEDSRLHGHRVPVPVTTLDAYLGGRPRIRISLIKCDAEGHELEVFRGARQVLLRDRPHLLFECETRHLAGGRPEDVFAFLQELGYRGYCLGKQGVFGTDRFDAALHQAYTGDPETVNNFLFTVTELAPD
jgi:FkbM family methyltransferase